MYIEREIERERNTEYRIQNTEPTMGKHPRILPWPFGLGGVRRSQQSTNKTRLKAVPQAFIRSNIRPGTSSKLHDII